MSDMLLQNLNEPQCDAVSCTEGPLLILAGAGSGKTRVITHRIAYLVAECKVAPESILAVTFTNKAAQEMRERVGDLLKYSANRVNLGTFHSICARFLREHIDFLGYQKNFSIYDSSDQLTLLKQVMKDLEISTERFQPKSILAAIGKFKQDMQQAGDLPIDGQNIFLDTTARVYEAYQAKLKDVNALDFDDLLNFAVRILAEDPELRSAYNRLWHYILVDEYQDTNKAQYSLLRLLTRDHDNICVVGDDDQSIYRWRGANLKNILSFESDFPSAKVIKLEQNYRSTECILNIAHNVISQNIERKPKKLWTKGDIGDKAVVYAAETESREAQFVIDTIGRAVEQGEASYGDFAIFYRTNAQSRPFESRFVLAGMPYSIVGGLRFFERKEIKDILAYLRILENPDDEVNLLRIINVPARGIGAATIGKIRSISKGNKRSLWEAMQDAVDKKMLSIVPSGKVKEFIKLIKDLRKFTLSAPIDELVPEILQRSGYWEKLNLEGTEEAIDRIGNLNELVNEVSEFARAQGDDATIAAFLERTALVSDIDSYEDKKDSVTLMTVHSAKGLEFPYVFLTGLEEQLFPHSRSIDSDEDIEEERRLAYVGITRARKQLYLTLARTRMVFGQTRATNPSRFLGDISPSYLEDRSTIGRKPTRRMGFQASSVDYDGFDDGPDEEVEYEASYDADTGELSSPFQPGVKAFHPSFGVGKVIAVVGEGENAKVTILFPGTPLKKIMAKYLQVT